MSDENTTQPGIIIWRKPTVEPKAKRLDRLILEDAPRVAPPSENFETGFMIHPAMAMALGRSFVGPCF